MRKMAGSITFRAQFGNNLAISEGPPGGVKGSGFGKDMSQESVLEYTTTPHIMIKHGQHEVKEGFRPV